MRLAGDRVVTLGVGLALSAMCVQTTSHLVNEFFLDGRINNLDADAEFVTFAWAASVAVFGAGLGATLLAAVGRGPRLQLYVVGAVLTFFSLDEIIQIHEQLGMKAAGGFDLPDYVAVRFWLLLYGPFLLALTVVLWRLAQGLHDPARSALLLGLGLLVSAVVLEILGLPTKWLADRGVDWPDVLRIAAEEAAELGGWMLIATALFAALLSADRRASS